MGIPAVDMQKNMLEGGGWIGLKELAPEKASELSISCPVFRCALLWPSTWRDYFCCFFKSGIDKSFGLLVSELDNGACGPFCWGSHPFVAWTPEI